MHLLQVSAYDWPKSIEPGLRVVVYLAYVSGMLLCAQAGEV